MSHHRSHRRARRVLAQFGSAALIAAGVAVVATTATSPMANAAGNAISTTTNVAATTGNGTCVHPGTSSDPINCNTYSNKADVWLSNLPGALGDGEFFLAVTKPGAQANPNDGAPGLLSSDTHQARSFKIVDGVISWTGGGNHEIQNNRVQLFPYNDTPNNGGVYIASVCRLAGYPVSGSDCKHDAFKVKAGVPVVAERPVVLKDAAGTYDRTFDWTIGKAADRTHVDQVSGNVAINYTVTVGHDAGLVSNVTVGGTITVFNPNDDPMVADVADQLSDGTLCAVTGGNDAVLAPGNNDFAYTCALASLPQGQLDNTATATWDTQPVGTLELVGGVEPFTFSNVSFTGNAIDECTTVTDSMQGALGVVCVGDPNPTLFQYQRVFPLTTPGCTTYNNTATSTTNDLGVIDTASASVEICKTPLNTGAHTIGFWTNKNGQGVIKGGTSTGTTCNSGTYLRTFKPFQDLSATANCAAVVTYVNDVISQASGSVMNKMLKAQMLATALSVYFTGPGSTPATQKFLPNTNLGAIVVDLTQVKGRNVSGAFGGAPSLSVSAALTYAGNQSSIGGGIWYANAKPVQTDAKDLFDAINNNIVYAP